MKKNKSISIKEILLAGITSAKTYWYLLLIFIATSVISFILPKTNILVSQLFSLISSVVGLVVMLFYLRLLDNDKPDWKEELKTAVLQIPGYFILSLYISLVTFLRLFAYILVAGLIGAAFFILPKSYVPENYTFFLAVAYILWMIGSILYGIYKVGRFYLGYSFALFIFLYKQFSIRDSIKRSRKLMEGHYLKMFKLMVVSLIPLIFLYILGIFFFILLFRQTLESGQLISPYIFIGDVRYLLGSQLVSLILISWFAVTLGATYAFYKRVVQQQSKKLKSYKKQKLVRWRYYLPTLIYILIMLAQAGFMYFVYRDLNIEEVMQEAHEASLEAVDVQSASESAQLDDSQFTQ